MKMKRVIIFGSTGTVGAYVTKYAVARWKGSEYEIIATGRKETNFWSDYGVKYYSVDITNKASIEKLPKENVFAVILLAAQIPTYMEVYRPEKYIETNVVGVFNVLEYCRKACVDRILFTTTISDSSLETGKVIAETYPHKFSYTGYDAMYAITKNTGVELVNHYCEEYGMKNFVFRLPTIYCYTPHRYYYPNGKKTLRPLFYFIELAQQGKIIELWGNPKNSKDMCHVYDCAQMLCKAVERFGNGGFYNVGTGRATTIQDELETIIDLFSPSGKASKIVYLPEKETNDGHIMEITRGMKELGYTPEYDCRRLLMNIKEEMENYSFSGM